MKDIQIADRLLRYARNDDVNRILVVRFLAAKPPKT